MALLIQQLLRTLRSRVAPGMTRRAQWSCLLVLLLSGVMRTGAEDVQPTEYQIKAAFLVNFPKYVDWPDGTFVAANSPVIITVVGETKFGDDLNKMVTGRTINGRPLIVNYVAAGEPLPPTNHILFVGTSEKKLLPGLLESLHGAPVLTVGEVDDFLDDGGMINLAKQGKKISVEVNLAPAKQAGLHISARLLGIASVVKGRER